MSEPTIKEQMETLIQRTMQLHALLEMTYGSASETFESMSNDIRDCYLWACSDMAVECRRLADSVLCAYSQQQHGGA